MTWLISNQKSQETLANNFKELMENKRILKIAGAHDGMAGLVGKKAGFEALYLSGAALTASKGIPDIGLLNSSEVAEKANEIVRATNLPLLVDVDNGFGGPLNIARTVKELLEARVAAIQLEDQSIPKKCGHLNGKQLISTEEMVEKIKMVKKIAPSLILVARTDARGVEGMDKALERAKAYAEAGADAIFPEAMTSETEFIKVSDQINAPLLANMTEFGKTPYINATDFRKMGYAMVIYPVTSLRVAAKAYERAFNEIAEKGTQENILGDMQTREELYEIIKLHEYENLDNNIAETVIPDQD
ncbi:methylisocitrate lyase [Lentibacillus amyloliquefaciens]|uniref:Methylisocitrate lyase n=1 Tax=Lentibacillus amyloliquefaciens TaxID=1472767 RepID=A0A0U4EZX1_9BACI|nr:methylisocitrate lyase [Lentibacillus amyloliquefaciens]ALX48823.1 methylisocitrate lyase [Lentibacillus amyloliquefaciens]